MSEMGRGEKVAIYAGGAFVIGIVAWVIVAFLRAEGMLDRNIAVGAIAVAAWNSMRLRRKRKP
jgi:hypothetical protein